MSPMAALAWPEAERLRAGGIVLLVPVGATEQHGPHLPLSTDTDIALALAEAAEQARTDVAAAPAVPYGASGEHAGFAGTLSIGRAATEVLLVELGRSASMTFPRILLLSTHGGNADPVRRAVATLRAEGRDVRAWGPRWDGDAHAGRMETSLMLAIAPSRVRLAAAAPGATEPIGHLLPRLHEGGVRSVSANGVLGDPAGASADEGRALLRLAGEQLARLLDTWPAA